MMIILIVTSTMLLPMMPITMPTMMVLLDQAGWHLSTKLAVPDNITIKISSRVTASTASALHA